MRQSSRPAALCGAARANLCLFLSPPLGLRRLAENKQGRPGGPRSKIFKFLDDAKRDARTFTSPRLAKVNEELTGSGMHYTVAAAPAFAPCTLFRSSKNFEVVSLVHFHV